MNQSEEWTNRRLTLLRNHVQEWKNTALQETQARNAFVAKYQAEKDHISQKANAVGWANYLTQYVERLTNMAIANQEQRQAMRSRQDQESIALERRITGECLLASVFSPPYS